MTCKSGHLLQLRNTPKTRFFIVSGNHIYCDGCKIVLDIKQGYYTCSNSCNYDICLECYDYKAKGAAKPAKWSTIKSFTIAMVNELASSSVYQAEPD